ncbi:MAG: hypothetical protein HUK22_01610 [Thermoguttaceae bacterium]|nr:hypothetical protein [Thermoguttaceae bacterium]
MQSSGIGKQSNAESGNYFSSLATDDGGGYGVGACAPNACAANQDYASWRTTPPEAAFGLTPWGTPACGECCGGLLFQNLQLELGALGMRNPLDYQNMGNFGGDFGINWASGPTILGVNIQSGARVTQTALHGVEANGQNSSQARTQCFWTSGLFFRAPEGCAGWNFGVAYDMLSERYYRKYNLSQMRTELSYSLGGCGDIGFRGAFALNDKWTTWLYGGETGIDVEVKARPSSYYTMFWRMKFDQGATATVFGGATEYGEGLVGASAEAPLSASFAVKAAATYVIPKDRGLGASKYEESWNVSCGLVWYLGGNAQHNTNPSRPLFEVADNGSFLQNFVR